MSAVQDGAGSVATFAYGLSSTNTTTVTNMLGAQTIYTIDPATGAMLSLTDPNGNTTRFTYDANTDLLTTTDPLGHVITNTTTGASDQTGTIDPLGIGTGTAYNALHEPAVITDTQGQRTTTHYNALGDPITVTDPLSYTTLMTPAANGLPLARTDGNGHTTRYGYDAFGDTVAVTDALGRVSGMSYDTGIGRVSSVIDPKNQTTRFTYDAEDRALTTTYADGKTVRNYIDADGNVTETVDTTGATFFTYDGDNRVTRQTYPDGTVVRYTYDAAGRLASKAEPGMPATTYQYDPAGRLKEVDNSLWGPITYSYDAASRLTALKYPNSVSTSYTLDADNRVTGITETSASGGGTLLSDAFSYVKPNGSMGSQRMGETRADDGIASSWSYGYDADARLTAATAIVTGPTTAPIDDGAQGTGRDQIAYSGSWGHCTAPPTGTYCNSAYYKGTSSVSAAAGAAATLAFSGTAVTFYATEGPDHGIAAVSVDGAPETQVDLYSSGVQGNVAAYSVADLLPGSHTLRIRVTGAKGLFASAAKVGIDRVDVASTAPGDEAPATTAYRYGYDAVGNMTANNGTSQSYDAVNQITAAGGITFGFDRDGNQTRTTEAAGPAWGYDAANHTASYQDTGGASSFLTGAGGLRQTKAVTTTGSGAVTRGVFDGDLYRQTAPISRTLYYVTDPAGRLLALTDGATVYYYGRDGHGSVANLTDRNGAIVNTYRYDPYGNSLGTAETASLPNPWQYAGGYYDAESGLVPAGPPLLCAQAGPLPAARPARDSWQQSVRLRK